jgi:aspartate kinase
VKNTFTDHPGTLVADIAAYRPDRVATAVSHATGIARVSVKLGGSEGSREHMHDQRRIYRAMADAGVSLDMFTPCGDSLIFTIPGTSVSVVKDVCAVLDMRAVVKEGLSKVTLVGAGMHGVPGVMARLAEVLDEAGVSVVQSADSHTTISVLVPAGHTSTAVRALHDGFELGG